GSGGGSGRIARGRLPNPPGGRRHDGAQRAVARRHVESGHRRVRRGSHGAWLTPPIFGVAPVVRDVTGISVIRCPLSFDRNAPSSAPWPRAGGQDLVPRDLVPRAEHPGRPSPPVAGSMSPGVTGTGCRCVKRPWRAEVFPMRGVWRTPQSSQGGTQGKVIHAHVADPWHAAVTQGVMTIPCCSHRSAGPRESAAAFHHVLRRRGNGS